MLSILIIEDEKLAAEKLELLLKQTRRSIQVMAVCPSVESSIAWLSHNEPDLIFCDIHLSDGNAFHIFQQIDVKTPIVFTTAYDQYALKAFEQHSIDYLLKPLDLESLNRSLDKYQHWEQSARNPDLNRVIDLLINQQTSYKKRFLVRIGRSYDSIPVESIAFFHSADKQTFLTNFEGRAFPIDDSLTNLMSSLDPTGFYPVNRSFIVNLEAVQKIYRVSRKKVILKTAPPPPVDIIIPEERFAGIRSWLDQ